MRKMTVGALAGVAALAGFVCLPLTADEPKSTRGDHHAAFMDCAKECGQCALACDACAAHCGRLIADGMKDHLKTMQTCQDCASVCGSAACITARGGPFSDLICTACADACKRCGEACDAHGNDRMMKKCADECRQCEKACREMVKHTGAH